MEVTGNVSHSWGKVIRIKTRISTYNLGCSWATLHSHILAANYIPFQYQLSIQQYILCTGIRAYEEDVDIQIHVQLYVSYL